MAINEGTLDRVLRVVAGIILAVAAIAAGGGLGIVLGIVAAIALVTGAVGRCPLYRVLGVCTVRNSASAAR